MFKPYLTDSDLICPTLLPAAVNFLKIPFPTRFEVGEINNGESPNERDENTPKGKPMRPQAKLTCLILIFIIPQNFLLLCCGLLVTVTIPQA